MKKVLKWTGITLLGLVIVLVSGGIALSSIGSSKANKTYEVTESLLSTVPEDSASLAYGEHLSKIHGCQSCHTENLGGKVFVDAPPFMAVASNLTSGKGGIAQSYSISDWDRAIRYGIKPDGTAEFLMPSKTLHNLSDADTGALIAYMRSVAPVDNELPVTELRTLGKILTAAGEFDAAAETHTVASRAPVPPAGITVEYGKYLSSITCTHCHGANMEGGAPLGPDAPAPPPLVASGQWSFDMFQKAMRTGVTPTDHLMNNDMMPWEAFKHMTDEELQAIHLYLQTL